jgi:hypothetical protein
VRRGTSLRRPQVTAYEVDAQSSIPGNKINVYIAISSSPDLGPTQHSIQCALWSLSLDANLPNREDDYLPPSGAELLNAWSFASNPSLVRNLCVGMTLNFTFIWVGKLIYHSEERT